MVKKLLVIKEFPLILTALGILVVLGIILAWRSIAGQLPYVSIQPETGSLSGNVKVVADSTATGAGYIVFGASSSSVNVNAPSGNDPVIAAAGSIGQSGGAAGTTAQLILSDQTISKVLALGDLAGGSGTPSDYSSYWKPNWGRLSSLIWPTPGSHDYLSSPSNYYNFFNNKFSKWWSSNIGQWHIISLNSQEDHSSTSPQNVWLKQDLASHTNFCTLAFASYPRFSSGNDFGSDSSMQPLWQTFYNGSGDIFLAGESHHYERFNLLDPAGHLDQAKGIASFVVGTGGTDLIAASTLAANSTFRDSTSHGVLKITLHPTSYDWEFVTIDSQVLDSGTGQCH